MSDPESGAQKLLDLITAIDAQIVDAQEQRRHRGRGTVPCPACGQTVTYTFALRRHGRNAVAGRCETPGCLVFMT